MSYCCLLRAGLPKLLTLAATACLSLGSGVAAAEPVRLALAVPAAPDFERVGAWSDLMYAAIESSPEISIHRVPAPGVSHAGAGIKVAMNSSATAIAVIYPDIGEPYRGVFTKIIEGVESKTGGSVPSFAVGSDANTDDMASTLRKQKIKVVIALGRNGLKVASSLANGIGIVGGGVISAPDAELRAASVLSLAPDPELMFARLRSLAPAVRRVHVVYDPGQNAWLMRLAREAAAVHGLELVTYEATELRQALRHYQTIVSIASPATNALWLPQDGTTVDESSVLPMVLEKSWQRSQVVFSSNVSHVRRGALFALYPNNVGLGRNLATYALDYIASGGQEARGVVPLTDVLIAVNVRTAGHLGLRISYEQQRQFDLVFPEP
jgi:putative ABC transport system substrate-binding protein